MRRFWTMLAHYHGQTWNASELARSMGLDGKTVRRYLDILTGTYMVRQLQPWFANVGKRQVKAPKIYLRDTGILHHLLALPDHDALLAHPRVGASWEGFVVEQALAMLRFPEAPRVTKSMRVALENLRLAHLYVIYPGSARFPADERITMWPAEDLAELPGEMGP